MLTVGTFGVIGGSIIIIGCILAVALVIVGSRGSVFLSGLIVRRDTLALAVVIDRGSVFLSGLSVRRFGTILAY